MLSIDINNIWSEFSMYYNKSKQKHKWIGEKFHINNFLNSNI